MLKRLLRIIAEYFVFVWGFLFIFVIGILYAFIKPQGATFNLIFLLITIGWIIFIIKYFWDLMEKHNSSDSSKDDDSLKKE